jgi:prevent-host-death family protein
MRTAGIFEAKQNFSALIDAVAGGEEVRITRHGKEVARLLPVQAQAAAKPAQLARELAALEKLRAQVKPGPGWRALRDEGRER